MTQEEEKQLLLKDLCGMLPYGVKFESYDKIPIVEYCVCDNVFVHEQGYVIIDLLDKDTDGNTLASTSINLTTVSRLPKPYLRPMCSMTDEEKEHLQSLHNIISDENYEDGYSPAAWETISNFNDYCHEHHLDNRGLISKGLALKAPEGMYIIN